MLTRSAASTDPTTLWSTENRASMIASENEMYGVAIATSAMVAFHLRDAASSPSGFGVPRDIRGSLAYVD